MCGILALLGLTNGAESHRRLALKLAKRLRHRGPDWSGIYVKGNNIIAHERLAIVGVDNGEQPLFSLARDLVLGVNGEIYNHKLLKGELKQPHEEFQTQSDSEVILHLYREHCGNADAKTALSGMSALLNRLNGIFAFILYDEKNDRYVAARDHMGIIPLYIGWGKDGSVWIASELKALKDNCVRFMEFPPGHFYFSTNKEFTQWYNPVWWDEKYLPSTKVDLTKLRESLENAVVRQMMSDTPYGVLLSGGLDSSLVSAIACRHAARVGDEKSLVSSPRLHSFAIGLKGSPDLAAARKVASFLKTIHHEFNFTVEEGLNAIHDVIYHLETFDVTTIRASTPMYLLSRRIKSLGVKMVLSGEGSDEIFGGYLYFHKAPNKEEFHKENVRKLKALHQFDCLRANKSTAAWGVEARVPFLDPEFLNCAMNIDPIDKMITPQRMEKWVLRKAFEGYLPDDILWRQKEQFSDGVGYGWIDALKAQAEKSISDEALAAAKVRFPYGTPATKEAYMYRAIFEEHFPQQSAQESVPCGPSIACSTPTAILWDESFKNRADPSGRAVKGVHASAYGDASNAAAGSAGSSSLSSSSATATPVAPTAAAASAPSCFLSFAGAAAPVAAAMSS